VQNRNTVKENILRFHPPLKTDSISFALSFTFTVFSKSDVLIGDYFELLGVSFFGSTKKKLKLKNTFKMMRNLIAS
jgi:hypothetical protein